MSLKEKFEGREVEFEPEEQGQLKEKIIANLESLHYTREALREVWRIVQRRWQE